MTEEQVRKAVKAVQKASGVGKYTSAILGAGCGATLFAFVGKAGLALCGTAVCVGASAFIGTGTIIGLAAYGLMKD